MFDVLFDQGSILIMELIKAGQSNFLIPYTLTRNSGFAFGHSKAMKRSGGKYEI